MKILIAEDDAISRTVIRKRIEKLGHEPLVTEDGLEAWEAYQNNPDIDAVISDWMMPGIEGPELCRRIRSSERGGHTFFIFLTALGSRDNLLEGMEAGADEYLTKPLNAEELDARLATASRTNSLQHHLHDLAIGDEETSTGIDQPSSYEGSDESKHQATPRAGSRSLRQRSWDILVSQGKLTEEQLRQAVEAQKENNGELGVVLVSLGFISSADLAQAQAQRLNLEYVELSEMHVDASAVELVSQKVLQKHGALPLYVENSKLYVAMTDPTNILAIDDLAIISGYRVVPVVVSVEDLHRTQNKMFGDGEEVVGILQDAIEPEVEDPEELDLGGGAGADEAPVVRLISSILQRAVGEGASDVHLEPQEQDLIVRFRIDGVLRQAMSVPPKLKSGLIARAKILGSLDIAERRVPQDGRFSARIGGKKVDFRVASLPTAHGEEMVLRLLDTASLDTDLTGLGFDKRELGRYREVFGQPYGTVLITGPTGSGKSTTLYATLRELNSPEKKIITVEDPVEYRMPGVNQVQVNPRAGLTFASGLRSILRNDPDIVMIGEIRDHETAKTSIEAALTGHLVLATLHTNDAPGALTRLTDMGVEPFLSSSAVDCVIAQRLARRLCGSCRQPTELRRDMLEDVGFPFEQANKKPRFYKAIGCERCGGTGYRGRVGLYEMMVLEDEIREMVLARASTAEIGHAAERSGMVRLREDGLLKAAQGVTTIEEILRTVV